MAIAKHAKITDTKTLAPHTRLVELKMQEELGFIGGQYVIVDSGLVLPSGKAAKRAYSLLTADREQTRFELAVKRIVDGPCSGFVHSLERGTVVRFSGPWGKFRITNGVGVAASGHTLVLATDTGATAALGLLQSERFRPLLRATVFIWLRVAGDFLPEEFVRARIPGECREVQLGTLPPIHHPERLPRVRETVRSVLARVPIDRAFLSGDGTINYGLLDDLNGAGVAVGRDDIESFFNMPKKKSQ